MGRKGLAVSLVTPREEFIIRKFAKELGVEFQQRALYGGRIVEPREAGAARTSSAGRPRTERGSRPTGGHDNKDKNGSISRGTGEASSVNRSESKANERKLDRHRDRKNKGAPKWLKDKQPPRS
ncbi:hypothetical protein D3C85_1409970 [compost metagenome]